jgi:hypothetical protein
MRIAWQHILKIRTETLFVSQAKPISLSSEDGFSIPAKDDSSASL